MYLGNIYALRDWGHAKDYIEMCWKILQCKKSDDFIIATEKQYSVKFFVEKCFQYLGIKISWIGKGLKEKAIIKKFNKDKYPNLKQNMTVIKIDKKYFRPNEVDKLVGNSSKAKKVLNWKPKTTIYKLIAEMMENDLRLFRKKD